MTEVFFKYSKGTIEGVYHPSSKANAPVAVVFHPDPELGANMNNAVTYALYRCFAAANISVLRINLPGAGRSSGSPKDHENHFLAAVAALDWLQGRNPDASHYWVAGFSFGSYLAAQLALRRPEIENFILVAPPFDKYDFSFAVPCPLPGLIVQGDKDTFVNFSNLKNVVSQWRQKNNSLISLEIIKGADHFFSKYITALSEICIEYIDTSLAVRVVKPVRKKRRRRRRKEKDYDDSNE